MEVRSKVQYNKPNLNLKKNISFKANVKFQNITREAVEKEFTDFYNNMFKYKQKKYFPFGFDSKKFFDKLISSLEEVTEEIKGTIIFDKTNFSPRGRGKEKELEKYYLKVKFQTPEGEIWERSNKLLPEDQSPLLMKNRCLWGDPEFLSFVINEKQYGNPEIFSILTELYSIEGGIL